MRGFSRDVDEKLGQIIGNLFIIIIVNIEGRLFKGLCSTSEIPPIASTEARTPHPLAWADSFHASTGDFSADFAGAGGLSFGVVCWCSLPRY